MKKKAVVLCSGGMDSATAMAVARREGYLIYALSFAYGQRHAVELEKAKQLVAFLGACDHLILSLDLDKIGGSALTDYRLAVPKEGDGYEQSRSIPSTYVPARNTIFLSYSLAWAEVLKAEDIFIGVNVLDYSGYPDCRPEYIAAFETLARLGTKAGTEGHIQFRIHAPLISLTKADIIRKGIELGVDFALTHSCYDPLTDGRVCGTCDSCRLRLKGFAEAGMKDPVEYAETARSEK